jgi:1-hydroxycarotenoid 3,4-desaturase
MLRTGRIAVIGAGMAGLAAAMDLARAGFEVTVYERAATPGGKLRELVAAGRRMDAGPTVFTLRSIFDELFADAGESLDSKLTLVRAEVLARHAWDARGHLDLFADVERSSEAIGEFAGAREASGFLRFAAQARRVFGTLENSFIRASRPSPLGLTARVGLRGLADLWNIQPFQSLWLRAGHYFRDQRLRQLFSRYATYCGSSPFQSPATLMLVAHVEQAGVWYVEGGMHQLALQLAAAAARQGATLRYSCAVRHIEVAHGRVTGLDLEGGDRVAVDAVVCNADNNALAAGLFGAAAARAAPATAARARSLSAMTWNLVARTSGFDLAHHTVFFGRNYRGEFDDIFRRRQLPADPTIYACAQDRRDARRGGDGARGSGGRDGDISGGTGGERLFLLMNAPAIGDTHSFGQAEIEACETRVFELLQRFGLKVQRRPEATVVTTPSDFHRLFPATGGALYGPASHGWRASFTRPGSRSRIGGLYLAGGSSHPGPGVPMAVTSGRLAAACIQADRASIIR